MGPQCCLLGGFLFHWHRAWKRYEQPQECSRLFTVIDWPRQAGEAHLVSCKSSLLLPLPAVADGGLEVGIAFQPRVNAEEGLRARLPAS